ncbi:hypothetical protein C8J55DRAFT_261120 [Lentinula edodes]|uniref:Uncharacterized protein n=1 Tax=Lentinula lateritia TaxID=40482 RepID=A0A9W8ZSX9_9AGAR|nr:hypothetical protein C8J55DRAFT_261120 [Lentinula edodes]
MTSINKVYLGIRENSLEGFGPCRYENAIVRSPNGKQRRLIVAEIIVEGGVKRHICLILTKKE